MSVLSGDSSMRRWRRMCLRALCIMLETDSLEMGTVAAGSVSLDKAELMSLFSVKDFNKKRKQESLDVEMRDMKTLDQHQSRRFQDTALMTSLQGQTASLTFAFFLSQSSSQHLLSGLLPTAELKELSQQVACTGTEEPGATDLEIWVK